MRYTVQFSDDLTNWELLTIEPVDSASPADARDPATTPGRYYRLVAERP